MSNIVPETFYPTTFLNTQDIFKRDKQTAMAIVRRNIIANWHLLQWENNNKGLDEISERLSIDSFFDQWSNFISIKEIDSIRTIISQYIEYLDIFNKLFSDLEAYFLSEANDFNTQILLEIFTDPEINDEYFTLYIRQFIYKDDIMTSIRDFSRKANEYIPELPIRILINTDFQPPKENVI